ncbi:MAG: Flp pilus assembly complex ATPase component TadA [Pseudomonadota bacterium]|nr:Flp pilus assembly complex ATPase component TadA [Pseudomonadota bacterium]
MSTRDAAPLLRVLPGSGGARPIEAVLAGLGVAPNHVRLARLRAELTGEHLAGILADFGLLSGEGVARAHSLEHGDLPYFGPEQARQVATARMAALRLEVSDDAGYVPVDWDGRTLTVAIDEAARIRPAGNAFHRFPCVFVVASRESIRRIWGACYSASEQRFDEALQSFLPRAPQPRGRNGDAAVAAEAGSGREIRDLLVALLRHACLAGASDIHLHRSGRVGLVRLTVDGIGQVFRILPEACYERLLTRLIHDARAREDELRQAGLREGALDTSELAGGADGSLFSRFAFRIELGHARSGRTAVIRLLDRESATADFDSLGFDDDTALALRALVQQSSGLLLITGPTGSGKTTTLYALLKLIDPEQVSVQSIENPVEFHHGLWMQYEVRRLADHEGQEWGRWLKGLLRNAPRVILMGEVRDGDTARTLMDGANTGHLVMTSLHANSAASAIGRLRRLGVDPSDLADALLAVLAQRLVRTLCEACAETDPRADARRPAMRRACASGCAQCAWSGYRGRVMVHELLVSGPRVREAVLAGAPSDTLRDAGYLAGRTMWHSGERLLAAGRTSLEELERVLGRADGGAA